MEVNSVNHRRKKQLRLEIIWVCKKVRSWKYYNFRPQYPPGGFDDDWSCDGNAGFWGGWNNSKRGKPKNKANKRNNKQQGSAEKAAEEKPEAAAAAAAVKEEAKSSA